MNVKPIKSEADYDAALDRLEVIWDAGPGTEEEEDDELKLLVRLIEGYESHHHPLDPPDAPIQE